MPFPRLKPNWKTIRDNLTMSCIFNFLRARKLFHRRSDFFTTSTCNLRIFIASYINTFKKNIFFTLARYLWNASKNLVETVFVEHIFRTEIKKKTFFRFQMVHCCQFEDKSNVSNHFVETVKLKNLCMCLNMCWNYDICST